MTSEAIQARYKQAAHDIGDLFCWCVQNLKKFPPREGEWLDEVKRRLLLADAKAAERAVAAEIFGGSDGSNS